MVPEAVAFFATLRPTMDRPVEYIISWPEERYSRKDVRNSCRGPARMAVLRAAAEGRLDG